MHRSLAKTQTKSFPFLTGVARATTNETLKIGYTSSCFLLSSLTPPWAAADIAYNGTKKYFPTDCASYPA